MKMQYAIISNPNTTRYVEIVNMIQRRKKKRTTLLIAEDEVRMTNSLLFIWSDKSVVVKLDN